MLISRGKDMPVASEVGCGLMMSGVDRLKMVGIETRPIATDMMQFFIVREFPVKTFPYPPMKHDAGFRFPANRYAFPKIAIMVELMREGDEAPIIIRPNL